MGAFTPGSFGEVVLKQGTPTHTIVEGRKAHLLAISHDMVCAMS